MNIYTPSEARKNLFKIIDNTVKYHKPTYIKRGDNNVVLLSQEDYESLQETIYLLSIPKMKESIESGSKEQDCVEWTDEI